MRVLRRQKRRVVSVCGNMSGAKYCFDQEEFSHSDFQPVRFVTQISAHVALEALRDDLKRCFQKVDEELMVLINRDYTDFVKISSDLKGLDEKIAKVRAPLESARATGIELGSALWSHSQMSASKETPPGILLLLFGMLMTC